MPDVTFGKVQALDGVVGKGELGRLRCRARCGVECRQA